MPQIFIVVCRERKNAKRETHMQVAHSVKSVRMRSVQSVQSVRFCSMKMLFCGNFVAITEILHSVCVKRQTGGCFTYCKSVNFLKILTRLASFAGKVDRYLEP